MSADNCKNAQSPREVLQAILMHPMTDGACEQLRLSPKTTYLTALLLGATERALRGDMSAWNAVMNFADPPALALEDGALDPLSASLEQLLKQSAHELDSSSGNV